MRKCVMILFIFAAACLPAPAEAQRAKRVQVAQPVAHAGCFYQDFTRAVAPTGYGYAVCNPHSTRNVKAFWDFQDRRGGGSEGGSGGGAE